jgi:hypothetical protein
MNETLQLLISSDHMNLLEENASSRKKRKQKLYWTVVTRPTNMYLTSLRLDGGVDV